MADELDTLRRERDLYRRLLSIQAGQEPEPFLAEALELVVASTGARRGYLEIFDGDKNADGLAWWTAKGLGPGDVEEIRAAVSRGIVAEAVATGHTIVTSSALLDPRFGSRDSIRERRIEAVLCAPIGADPPRGVVYLEQRPEVRMWSEDDRERAELFARHLAPLADLLVLRNRVQHAKSVRETLPPGFRAEDIVGESEALTRVLAQAALLAQVEVTVLLTGESGTGKSQLARVIHQNSRRSAGPFVELNCAALPEGLVESELFGAHEGAHSTARRALRGKVAAAERGTLFLDEIGELPLSSQAKLLQLLQSRRYYPLGSSEGVAADVRVFAATNLDLAKAVAAKQFREDLFYRLQVLPLRLPTLAERRSDVPLLVRHLCAEAFERHGLPRVELSTRALRAVESADWPGNIRQLANAIEAAVIRAHGERAAQVEARHVFPDDARGDADAPDAQGFHEATRRFQRDLLVRTLEDTSWNVAEAARRLDLARSHVYSLIGAFGLRRED